MSRDPRKLGRESLSWGERLDEWQKLWGRGERSFFIGLGCREMEEERATKSQMMNV